MKKYILAILVVGFVHHAAAQLEQTLPTGFDFIEGNSASGAPFGGGFEYRYQQVFGSEQFFIIGDQGGWIYQFTFRQDTPGCQTFLASPGIEVRLSTTQRGENSLSSVFAENVGPDEVTVFGPGGIVFGGGPCQDGISPQPFTVHLPFQRQFFYDPSEGNLLLDVRTYLPATTSPFDVTVVAGDGVARAVAAGANATTATFMDSGGLITLLSATAVPEPSLTALVLAGGAICLCRRLIVGRGCGEQVKVKPS